MSGIEPPLSTSLIHLVKKQPPLPKITKPVLVVFAPFRGTLKFDYAFMSEIKEMLEREGRLCVLCEYILPPRFVTHIPTLGNRLFILSALKSRMYSEVWMYGEMVTPDFRELVYEAYHSRICVCNRTEDQSLAHRYVTPFERMEKSLQALSSA